MGVDAGKSSGTEPCHSQKVNMAASYYVNYNVRIESPISASQHTPVPNHGYPDLEDPSLQGHTPSSTACWTSSLKLLTQLYAETNHKTIKPNGQRRWALQWYFQCGLPLASWLPLNYILYLKTHQFLRLGNPSILGICFFLWNHLLRHHDLLKLNLLVVCVCVFSLVVGLDVGSEDNLCSPYVGPDYGTESFRLSGKHFYLQNPWTASSFAKISLKSSDLVDYFLLFKHRLSICNQNIWNPKCSKRWNFEKKKKPQQSF